MGSASNTPYERGFQAGTLGASRGTCRERGEFARSEWMRGYEDARELLEKNLTIFDELKLARESHVAAQA